MRTSLKNPFLSTVALFFAVSNQMTAAPVPIKVTNPGFESSILDDSASTSVVPGWSEFGNVGLFAAWNPEADFYATGVPEGQNVGDIYLSGAFSGCFQLVEGAEGQFQADTTYDLKVKVGNNLLDPFDGYIIQLVVNGIVIAQDDNSRVPATGSFVAASVKYSYNATLHSGLVGYPIEIRLLSRGLGGGYGDVNFDDVQLSYESTNPLASHGGPYRLSQGNSLSLNGSASLPSPGASSITSYEWDLNSNDNGGVFNSNVTTATPSAITYATLTGTYGMVFGENTIRLRVTDNVGKSSISAATVTIYPLFTYTGPNANGNSERWNVAGNWNSGSGPTPSGAVDVLIPNPRTTLCWSAITPEFTGNLYLKSGTSIQIGWTTQILPSYNCMGTPGQSIIYMDAGSSISMRMGGTPVVPAIQLNGNASFTLGSSTQAGASAFFNYPITGAHRLSLYGNNTTKCVANFNASNSFSEIYGAGGAYVDGGFTIKGNVPGSLGAGDITIGTTTGGACYAIVEINADDAMADTGTLSMAGTSATKIRMNANDTIAHLVIEGVDLPAGTYGSSSSSAANKMTWISGTGILTVAESSSKYWDINGTTAGAGGPSPSGTWDGSTTWSSSSTGTTATSSWISGSVASFSAGNDATGSYSVVVGSPAGITVTKSLPAVSGEITSLPNPLNVSKAWARDGGNAVVVLISAINATGFTASYAGLPMTVVGVSESRNSYSGIAYIISDSLPDTGNVLINMPYVKAASNSGGYARFGYAYSIVSLSGVASAGTPATKTYASGQPSNTILQYTTATNNSYVFGVSSDSDWHSNNTKTVTGQCSDIIFQGSPPAYYNTLLCQGSIPSAGSYSDSYGGKPTALVTLPFNAKTTSNPLLHGQGITGLRFEDGSVTLSGDNLQIQTASLLTVLPSVTAQITSQITGLPSTGITKKGSGTLILSNAANNYPGSTTIDDGILRLGASNALPSTTAFTLGGNTPGAIATLDLNGYNNSLPGLNLRAASSTSGSVVTTGAGMLTLAGDVYFSGANAPLGGTISGNLSLGASSRTFNIEDSLTAADDLSVSAVISGTGGLSKIGFGRLNLSGNNTYNGVTTVNGGLLVLSGANNSAATGGITVNNNGAIRFDTATAINGSGQNVMIATGGLAYFGASFGGGNIPTALTSRINPASTGVVAVDNFGSANFNFSGLNVYLGALSDVTYTGIFTPNGSVYRIGGGSGTITLANANALTGGGSLLVGGSVIIANSNNLSGTTTISSSGRLQIGAGGTAGSLSGSAITNNGVLVFNSSGTLTEGTNFQAPLAGGGVVEQSGAGNLVLNSSNSHSGGTNLVSGGLILGHQSALGSGSLTIYSGLIDAAGLGALTLTSNNTITLGGSFTYGGTANLNMGNGAVNNFGNPVITLNGIGKTLTFGGVMTNITGGNQSMTVNGVGNTLVLGGYKMSPDIYATNIDLAIGGTGNVIINGTVEDWSVDQNNVRLGTLTKTGLGRLTLTANNNYTGTTLVSGGMLYLASGTQNSPIIVNSGGALGFTLGNTITSTKKLTINAGSLIHIDIPGGLLPLTENSYTLMIGSSVVGGSLALDVPISGYFLEAAGDKLNLTKADITPPALDGVDIVDDKAGGPIAPGTLVTYTVTFSEDIDAATVSSVDFDNGASSSPSNITIGTILEITPGVFTVEVTPTTAGSLQLRVPTTSDIRDPSNNKLISIPAILDNTNIDVVDPNSSWIEGSDIFDDKFGGPISPGNLVTYTVYFNRDIDHTTVSSLDFANAGTSSIVIGAIVETAPGVFTVQVTPGTLGTLQLSIPTTADIRDPSNNMLDVVPAIVDDTTISVIEPYSQWSGVGNPFGSDANGDGIPNGLAWLLGAPNLNDNAKDYLPLTNVTSGDVYLYFTTLKVAARGGASIKVQHSTDLGLVDVWTGHQAEVPDTTSSVNGIDFTINPIDDTYIFVEARIPASAAGTAKKLFSRVSALPAP